MSTTAAADVKVASHHGRSGGSETAQTWRPGENLREAQMRAEQYAGVWTDAGVSEVGSRSESRDLRSFGLNRTQWDIARRGR